MSVVPASAAPPPTEAAARGARRRLSRGSVDGPRAAALARLRYVTDATPGIRRRRSGRAMRYSDAEGRPIRDLDVLRRIKRLAVPPAWTDVWICPDPNGHLQAVGRDARGRRQHRYHERWREIRDGVKYGRMLAFGRALPSIRRTVARHLALPGLPRDKVLATVVRLLEATRARVGNEEYRRANGSFGLTTLRSGQVKVGGGSLRLEFRGKGGKLHRMEVNDPRLARIVRRCQELPGHELFQHVDDAGHRRAITSTDVNAYLRAITGQDFTAKDFRTWTGTVLAARALGGADARSRRAVRLAVAGVAERLGNTPAICRKSYVHPAVIDAFLDGALPRIAASGPRGAEAVVKRLLSRVGKGDGKPRRAGSGGRGRGVPRPVPA
jgi:DNA topoisomerase-1